MSTLHANKWDYDLHKEVILDPGVKNYEINTIHSAKAFVRNVEQALGLSFDMRKFKSDVKRLRSC